MRAFLDSPARTILAGSFVSLVLFVVWIVYGGSAGTEIVAFVLRFLHVFAAMLWVGVIWFVNIIQLRATSTGDEADRAAVLRTIVPSTTMLMRHASHMTVVTGLLLLVSSGYVMGGLVFFAEVYTGPLRSLYIWSGVAAALVMWAILNLKIAPAIKVLTGQTPSDIEARARARDRVRTYARINLLLSLPVTFVMIGAAHL